MLNIRADGEAREQVVPDSLNHALISEFVDRLSSEKTPAIQEAGPSARHQPITARGGDVLLPGNRPRGSPIAQSDSAASISLRLTRGPGLPLPAAAADVLTTWTEQLDAMD
ncbi:unnamed protein product [Pleuronectes platessa]|uniref:Uncharacterized protein n=1 Tax=Pleuronectes platessa TaxID=8262 RepID=A0A9N7TW09_PLEPL|nr:unnamed protein product [Pleuronectes platessa]